VTQFNINNSHIEQLNNKGDNYKFVSDSGNKENKSPLFVDDIESFSKVRGVEWAVVAPLLNNGYLDVSEETVQKALEQILAVPFTKKDWGGEGNDLYTANVIVDGQRRPTAFLLKGNGLKKKKMEIKNCGKNGDQVVRLFQSPADLFVIQFVGNISEAVIQHAHGEIARLITQGREADFLIIDGQDTARLLYAYGKIKPPPAALPGPAGQE
jgi:hypothetical protein